MTEKLSKDENGAPSTTQKPKVTLPGTVEKLIPPLFPGTPEKAQIAVAGADHLYREIRVENTLQDPSGKEVGLKPGAEGGGHCRSGTECHGSEKTVRSGEVSGRKPAEKRKGI